MGSTTTLTGKLHLLRGGKRTERELVESITGTARAVSISATRAAQRHAENEQATNEAARAMRVMNARKLANKTRALMYEIEEVLDLNASKLRAYALHLENVAEHWSSE